MNLFNSQSQKLKTWSLVVDRRMLVQMSPFKNAIRKVMSLHFYFNHVTAKQKKIHNIVFIVFLERSKNQLSGPKKIDSKTF